MATSLPNELQYYICCLVLTDPGFNRKVMFELMTVDKLWAHYVCNYVYRHYEINKFVAFIGFYNTIVSQRQVLPYGEYIQSLNMTPINKYGVDLRAHQLIQRCPNLQSITLGHPTSLKPTTIRWLATHCKQLHTLSIGALDNYPFMLECDFSSLLSLNKIIFTTTPLSHSSFFTLPPNLKELRLIQMDTLDTATMVSFFEHGRRDHNLITRLAINRCPRLLDKITTWLPLHQLEWLFLSGRDIKDQHILAVLTMAGELDTLVLDNTQITTRVLDFMDSLGGGGGDDNSFVDQCRLHIKQLVMTNNNNIPPHKQQHTSRC